MRPELNWARGQRAVQGQRLWGSLAQGVEGRSLGPGQGPRLQHTVLVHDLFHQLLLLTAQGIELVPGRMGREEAGTRLGRQRGSGHSRCALVQPC